LCLRYATTAVQYAILFGQHNVSYSEAKQAAYRSLDRSFLREASVKAALRGGLDARFREFERDWLAQAHELGLVDGSGNLAAGGA